MTAGDKTWITTHQLSYVQIFFQFLIKQVNMVSGSSFAGALLATQSMLPKAWKSESGFSEFIASMDIFLSQLISEQASTKEITQICMELICSFLEVNLISLVDAINNWLITFCKQIPEHITRKIIKGFEISLEMNLTEEQYKVEKTASEEDEDDEGSYGQDASERNIIGPIIPIQFRCFQLDTKTMVWLDQLFVQSTDEQHPQSAPSRSRSDENAPWNQNKMWTSHSLSSEAAAELQNNRVQAMMTPLVVDIPPDSILHSMSSIDVNGYGSQPTIVLTPSGAVNGQYIAQAVATSPTTALTATGVTALGGTAVASASPHASSAFTSPPVPSSSASVGSVSTFGGRPPPAAYANSQAAASHLLQHHHYSYSATQPSPLLMRRNSLQATPPREAIPTVGAVPYDAAGSDGVGVPRSASGDVGYEIYQAPTNVRFLPLELVNTPNMKKSIAKGLLLNALRRGIVVLKFGRQGKPKRRILTCDSNVEYLYYFPENTTLHTDDRHLLNNTKCMQISDITQIREGLDIDPETAEDALETACNLGIISPLKLSSVIAAKKSNESKSALNRNPSGKKSGLFGSLFGGRSTMAEDSNGILYGTSTLRKHCILDDLPNCLSFILPDR